jgi:hypothetical protein
MLIAGGAVIWDKWISSLSIIKRRLALGATWTALIIGGVIFAPLVMPITPVNSPVWKIANELHDLFREQLGWHELVETIAGVYADLPAAEKSKAGIYAGNYGEAGAINLYGPAYGLPEAISGINSYWLRGYGDPPPQTLVIVGEQREWTEKYFTDCELVAPITNRYNVMNEETGSFLASSSAAACRDRGRRYGGNYCTLDEQEPLEFNT